ncbi:CorA family divalent cation transporter [Kribbella sp. VKM Ac-2500]|uniref:CorA family divalent cation transporter n=1 Tax=Kribbella sp. VKM Ac-2500 TaxID=2512214 RepID=UPI00351A8BFB
MQQNDDLRRISAWVAIAAVPTLVTGIYGMNFGRMPELLLGGRLPDRHPLVDRLLRCPVRKHPDAPSVSVGQPSIPSTGHITAHNSRCCG